MEINSLSRNDIYLKLSEGITEEEFIELFDLIIFSFSEPTLYWSLADNKLNERLETPDIKEILMDINLSNPSKNSWSLPENLKEETKLFLILRGYL